MMLLIPLEIIKMQFTRHLCGRANRAGQVVKHCGSNTYSPRSHALTSCA